MECMICGEVCTSKTMGSHIRHKHGMLSQEYYDKYIKQSGEGICICGRPTGFINISNGYHQYCSKECMRNDQASIRKKILQTKEDRYGDANYNNPEKSKQTCMGRYGMEHAQSSSIVREKIKQTWRNKTQDEKEQYSKSKINMWAQKSSDDKQRMVQRVKETKKSRYGNANYNNPEKIRQTCIERYGVDNIFKSKEIQRRIMERVSELYGVEHPAQSPDILNRMKITTLTRYGVDWFSKTDEFKKKMSTNRIYKTIHDNDDILGYVVIDDIYYIYKCPHPECSGCVDKFYISKAGHKNVRENQGTEICTNLLPILYERNKGTSIELFVRGILDTNSVEYISNDRKILSGKELDIYIPSHKLAIECNGVYWHSLKEPEFHYDKWSSCRDLEIQLLTIWEDQIVNKPDIVRSIILSKLGIYNEHIHARKCEIREVSSTESKKFLDLNHIQGSINGSIRLGLYYNDRLVSMMVFGRKRKALGSGDTTGVYELYRYCNELGVHVMGGASKLFNRFIKDHPDHIVESFSSNDISMGDLYRTLGFDLVSEQPISYWYIDRSMQRHHRYSFRKDILVKNGADPNLSESQITNEMGLIRIYDSGQQKWVFKNRSYIGKNGRGC